MRTTASDETIQTFLLGALGGVALGAALMALFESLAQVVFGWPVILLAILALAAGILRGKVVWVLLGALLSVPFSMYLAASPTFRLVGAVLPLLHLAAAFVVERGRRGLAALLVLPYVGVAAWIGWGVLNQ